MKIGKEVNNHWLASRMRVLIRSRFGDTQTRCTTYRFAEPDPPSARAPSFPFVPTTGTMHAVMITAVCSRFFILQLISCTGSRLHRRVLAYGWMRAASHSTTGPALMHAAYNLLLYLLCAS